MVRIAVIADDLTGAADTGIQFTGAALPLYLVSDRHLDAIPRETLPGILAVHTGTRNLPAETAADRVLKAADFVRRLSPGTVYKKIDSCFRGNIGPETDALLTALDLRASLILPAFPAQGRTTVHGIHYVRGIPVAESEMGKDPASPVFDSRIADLLARTSRFPVRHIDLDDLANGLDHLVAVVNRHLTDGVRHLVMDGATRADLDLAASLVRILPGLLPVGSAGLAMSLAPGGDSPESATLPPAGERMVFVCGSSSGVLADQADALSRTTRLPQVVLDPHLLVRDPGRATEAAREGRILRISPRAPGGPDPDRIVHAFADVVSRVVADRPPTAIFLSGGDTADAVLERLGAWGIHLIREILPGLPVGTILGGILDGIPVVTKAGAFGGTDTLSALHDILFRKD